MSYEKTNWTSGDVITAEKLNHMENGIVDSASGNGSDILYVRYGIKSATEFESDTPRSEINQAIQNGKHVCISVFNNNKIMYEGFAAQVFGIGNDDTIMVTCTSPSINITTGSGTPLVIMGVSTIALIMTSEDGGIYAFKDLTCN